jgi:hypothetical protein
MNAENSIKMRLLRVGKKQTDIFSELDNRGIQIGNFQQLNACINGRRHGEKANFILANVNRIIADWEAAHNEPTAKQEPHTPMLTKAPDINRLESLESRE